MPLHVLNPAEGFSPGIGFFASGMEEVREQLQQAVNLFASFNESDLERIISFERRGERHDHSLRWILHHLIDHEAQHKGQILMLKRLTGS